MADIWEAYKFLNESLKLNLSEAELMRAEALFKKQFTKDKRYPRMKNIQDWEFFAHLEPPTAKTKKK